MLNDLQIDHEVYLQEMAIPNAINAQEILKSNLKEHIDRVKEPNQSVC